MAYDEKLAEKLLNAFSGESQVEQRKMFGGLCVMVRGHMAAGVIRDQLMVRVGPDQHEECLTRKHTAPMDFTGRPSRGMVYVLPLGCKTSRQISTWVDRALVFNATKEAK